MNGPVTDRRTTSDLLGEHWWKLLELSAASCGEQDGFLSLGGTSWAAVRLRALVREHLGAEIPLTLLLKDNVSLARLREHLAAAPGAEPGAGRAQDGPAGPRPAAVHTRSRLAPAQRRMWMFGRIHPDSAAYNVVAALRLRGSVRLPELRSALADVTARHDALRACVDQSRPHPGSAEGEPQLVYADTVHSELRVSTTEAALDGVIDAFVRETAERPLPMTQAPMWNVALLRSRTAEDSCLVLSLHHMISDQHALDLLLADLAAAYTARCGADGGPARLPAAPRFAQHAEAEADAVGDARWTADLDHWRELLGDAPRDSSLPFLLPAPDRPSFAGLTHARPLGQERSERMSAFVRDHAVTPWCWCSPVWPLCWRPGRAGPAWSWACPPPAGAARTTTAWSGSWSRACRCGSTWRGTPTSPRCCAMSGTGRSRRWSTVRRPSTRSSKRWCAHPAHRQPALPGLGERSQRHRPRAVDAGPRHRAGRHAGNRGPVRRELLPPALGLRLPARPGALPGPGTGGGRGRTGGPVPRGARPGAGTGRHP
ncbi:hypothetical protein GXW82_08965 [Streptacidiphilus sp. 4-A2]|nr:hypothetical protein [Streptacidiphilus sp. 4-A2]